MAYTKKTLEELNVIDDFLMNSLASDKEVGEEFCRVVLSTLLQRKIGKVNVTIQKVIPPADPNLKGIRLDVKVEEPLAWDQDGGEKAEAMKSRRCFVILRTAVRKMQLMPLRRKYIGLQRK